MVNFSLGKQIDKELDDFASAKIQIAAPKGEGSSVRFGIKKNNGYYFNQGDTLTLLDLYYNSQFENGKKDKEGNQRIFLNVGKFRSDVASKQIDIDTKEFLFEPDDYADPWTAFFMQKDFREWVKDTDFPDLVNEVVDALPRYGTVVCKKIGNNIVFVPLQTIKNQQNARSLKEASYVIEEHEDMEFWEIMAMPNWNKEGLSMKFGDKSCVYERYGYVPLSWYKAKKGLTVQAGDEKQVIYVMAIAMRVPKSTLNPDGWHVLYVNKTECPYREVHWSRQFGRWLGIGIIEDLLPNQIAKNIIVNLQRKSLQWAGKRIFQSTTTDMVAMNLVKDVPDGGVLEVGQGGTISRIDLGSRDGSEFNQFLSEFEQNADQRAFTYEASLMNMGGGATSFRIGALLTQVAQAYFDLKKEKVGLFFRTIIMEFKIPKFIQDMGDAERNVQMFSGEPGFEALKAASIEWVKGEAIRISLLNGHSVDPAKVADITSPFSVAHKLLYGLPKSAYKNAKYKFNLDITQEGIDLKGKLQTLQMLYQMWAARGDPRAESVAARMAALSGENIAVFGSPAPVNPQLPPPNAAAPTPVAPMPVNPALKQNARQGA